MTSSPANRPDVALFIARLADNPKDAEAIAQAEIDDLVARVSPGSLRTYLSWRRTAVFEAFGAGHPTYDMLRLTDAEYAKLRDKYQGDVSARQTAPIRLRRTREMIELATALMQGQMPIPGRDDIEDEDDAGAPAPKALRASVHARILGLCLITGRRPFEIAANPETRFTPIMIATDHGRIRDRFHVAFRGQVKTRGAEGTMAHKVNTIPVLAPADLVIASFEALRDLIPGTVGLPHPQFNAAYSMPLGRLCKRLFGPFWSDDVAVEADDRQGTAARGKRKVAATEISPRDLRTIYGAVCDKMFNLAGTPNQRMMSSEYLARIMGHRENDLTTAQSYAAIVIEDLAAPGQPRNTAVKVEKKAAGTPASENRASAPIPKSPELPPHGLPAAVAGAARRLEAAHADRVARARPHPLDLFTGLALLTGLSPRELIDPAISYGHRVQRVETAGDGGVLRGTIKDKTAILATGPDGDTVIPILQAAPDVVLDAIARLRAAIAKGKIRELDKIVAHWTPLLDERAQKQFPKIAPSLDLLRQAHAILTGRAAPAAQDQVGDGQAEPVGAAAEADATALVVEPARETAPATAGRAGKSSRRAAVPPAEAPIADQDSAATAEIPFAQRLAQLDAAAVIVRILAQQQEIESTSRRRRFVELWPIEFEVDPRPRAAGEQLVVSFQGSRKKAPIAYFPKGVTLSQAHLVDLVDAWVKNDRKPLDQAQAIDVFAATTNRTRPPAPPAGTVILHGEKDGNRRQQGGQAGKAARKPASAGKTTPRRQGQGQEANTRQQGGNEAGGDEERHQVGAGAPPIEQLLANLRSEHLDRSARLKVQTHRGATHLVVEFDERPGEHGTIASLDKGQTLSDIQIGDIFHQWANAGRKTLTRAQVRKILKGE